MKRFLCLFLAALMLPLTACGDDVKKDDRQDTDATLEDIFDIRWGVDIQGGVDVTFGPVDEGVRPTAEQLDAIKTIVENRLVARDISDYEAVSDVSAGEVVVRFPWTDDQASAEGLAEELIRSGRLQFYEGEGTQDSDGYDVPPAAENLILDGTRVVSAEAALMDLGADPQYVVSLVFDDAGAMAFETATRRLAGKGKISIWLDFGTVWAMVNNTARYALLQVADVNEAITGGEAVITGFADYEEAKDVANLITFGTLPFDIVVKNLSNTSPTMG